MIGQVRLGDDVSVRPGAVQLAFGAMNAVSDIFGRSLLRLNMAMLRCFVGTPLFMIAIPAAVSADLSL
jgi:hypothetical protein